MKVRRIPCPTCNHPIWVRPDKTILTHVNSQGQICPAKTVDDSTFNQYNDFHQELINGE